MKRSPFFLLIFAIGLAFENLPAQVVLSLINPETGTGQVTVAPGGEFTLLYRVSGLIPPGLNRFDTQLDALPPNVSLTGFVSMLPPGWVDLPSPSDLAFGGALFFAGSDITGTSDLAAATFSVGGSAMPGASVISFAPPGGLMALYDADDNPLAFTSASATLNIVPEPTAVWLMVIPGLSLLFKMWHKCAGRRAMIRKSAGRNRPIHSPTFHDRIP